VHLNQKQQHNKNQNAVTKQQTHMWLIGALRRNGCLASAPWLVWVKTVGFQSLLDLGIVDKGFWTSIMSLHFPYNVL